MNGGALEHRHASAPGRSTASASSSRWSARAASARRRPRRSWRRARRWPGPHRDARRVRRSRVGAVDQLARTRSSSARVQPRQHVRRTCAIIDAAQDRPRHRRYLRPPAAPDGVETALVGPGARTPRALARARHVLLCVPASIRANDAARVAERYGAARPDALADHQEWTKPTHRPESFMRAGLPSCPFGVSATASAFRKTSPARPSTRSRPALTAPLRRSRRRPLMSHGPRRSKPKRVRVAR